MSKIIFNLSGEIYPTESSCISSNMLVYEAIFYSHILDFANLIYRSTKGMVIRSIVESL